MVLFEGSVFATSAISKIEKSNTKITLANWLEIGGSYAQVINDNKKYTDKIGF
jgi:hypothetical protein